MARSRRRRWPLLVGFLLIVAVAAAAAELLVRGLVEDRIAARVESEWGGTADAAVSSTLVLPQLLSDELSSVELDIRDAAYNSMTGISGHAELENVRWDGNDVSASRSRMEINVPAEGLEQAVSDSLPVDLTDVAISSLPESQQMELASGQQLAVTLLVTPSLEGDAVIIEIDDVQLGGSLPELDLGFGEGSTYSISELSDLPLGLSPTGLTVIDEGVLLTLDSG
ncbi:DUF2993 domain-containing protein [Actinobacteria bacterium YIM 96077]|uniref:DUF2993 domain-containing protein n=1 Tax=Phytoactinopolyspora halophila TaxID=1981511 RepID=A0A329QT22_9ACTN|nr:DUF2993 domain-containing protein [Phytoactinopolyspora halophila]AYY14936.1 DUF2993 domain-containing protein [Actinobacteria bacterium YIM 96077]RAW15393.1 hypothetical protein DPM12_09075 [Phytoactinopolyspora halophila]